MPRIDKFKKRIWIFFIDVLIMIGVIIVLSVVITLFSDTENDSSISETKPEPELETETKSVSVTSEGDIIFTKAAPNQTDEEGGSPPTMVDDKKKIQSDKVAIGNAKIACVARYYDAAIYDSDICESCVEVKESSPQLLPRFNYWWVKIDGKMLNYIDVWEGNKAECRVDKNTHQIISFLFPDQFGPLKSDPPIYKSSSELEIE